MAVRSIQARTITSRSIQGRPVGIDNIPFTFTVRTTNAGSPATDMILPLVSGESYDFVVDWGDGNIEAVIGSLLTSKSHAYSVGGDYTIRITGDFPRIHFNNGGDRQKMLSILNWGGIKWSSMNGAFFGCLNLQIPASDAPDLSNATDMGNMLFNCISLACNIDHWNVGTITDFSGTIANCAMFNSPLNNWDMSSALTLNSMLFGCSIFNQPVNGWDVLSVTNFQSVFQMCTLFDQPISGWDVSSGTNFTAMLAQAVAFDQDLSSLDISAATTMASFLTGGGLSTANYDLLLNAWSLLSVQSSVAFDAGSSIYTIATSQAARDILTGAPNLWTIIDGGGV